MAPARSRPVEPANDGRSRSATCRQTTGTATRAALISGGRGTYERGDQRAHGSTAHRGHGHAPGRSRALRGTRNRTRDARSGDTRPRGDRPGGLRSGDTRRRGDRSACPASGELRSSRARSAHVRPPCMFVLRACQSSMPARSLPPVGHICAFARKCRPIRMPAQDVRTLATQALRRAGVRSSSATGANASQLRHPGHCQKCPALAKPQSTHR